MVDSSQNQLRRNPDALLFRRSYAEGSWTRSWTRAWHRRRTWRFIPHRILCNPATQGPQAPIACPRTFHPPAEFPLRGSAAPSFVRFRTVKCGVLGVSPGVRGRTRFVRAWYALQAVRFASGRTLKGRTKGSTVKVQLKYGFYGTAPSAASRPRPLI